MSQSCEVQQAQCLMGTLSKVILVTSDIIEEIQNIHEVAVHHLSIPLEFTIVICTFHFMLSEWMLSNWTIKPTQHIQYRSPKNAPVSPLTHQ